MACLLVSCSRSSLELELGIRTKVFVLEQETGTKVVETAGRNFSWTAGDPVQYYKLLEGGAASSSVTQTANVAESGVSSTLGVEYVYPGEKKLVAAFLGTAIAGGNVHSLTKNSFTVDGGIPVVQDGTMLPYLVCAGTAEIETSNSLVMKHLQTFVSFSLNSVGTVSGNFNRIVISDKSEAVPVAGNAAYTFNENTGELVSCSIVPDAGASGTVTINLSSGIEAGKIYYAAISPASFTDGLRVTLYKDDKKLAYATTRAGEVLEKGRINDLGTLDFHNVIPADAAPVITPEYSSICKTDDLTMTKKLWATFSPEDVSGITWKIVKAGVDATTFTADPVEIENYYGTVTPGEKEAYYGKDRFTAIVTPKCAKGWLLVKATLDGDEALSDYALVKIDDFIDVGNDILWARSNLKGGETAGIRLVDNISDVGDYYQWGYLEPMDMTITDPMAEYTRWGGTWNGTGLLKYGGKYNPTDTKSQLDTLDDVCHRSTAGLWHIPTWDEIGTLTPTNRSNMKKVVYNGRLYVCYSGMVEGFDDVLVWFIMNGTTGSSGGFYHTYSDMYVQSSKVRVSGDVPGLTTTTNFDPYSFPLLLCQAYVAAGVGRYSGWGIRPVRSKTGWYPTIGTAPYSE